MTSIELAPRGAKMKALENAEHQRIKSESDASEHDSFSEADKKGSLTSQVCTASHYRRPSKLRRTFAMQDVNIILPDSEHEPEQSDVDSDDAQRNVHAGADCDSDSDSNAGLNDEFEEDEDLDAAASMLSDETPTWGDIDDAVSESIESMTSTGGELSISSESDNEGAVNPKLVRAPAKRSVALLVRTEKGKVKLLDQNLQTRQVIQAAISEVKCHVIFVHGYPELVEKNQLSMQTLLTIAEKHGMHAIKEHLQVDELYALQLGALVDACIPIMRHELKYDACTNVDGYFRLGHKDFAKAKKMMEKLVYIYAMKFDVNNNAMPIRNRPYQGELLVLLSNQLFHSSRAVGMKFASCFVEIAKNKLKRPKIPIPFLALVATVVVYSALLWKSLGSPGKFNFSGNQFSKVYSYHVKSLEQLKHNAPGKFHYMMADIYEAAHKLKHNGATGDHIELNAFELLDLEGMEED
ncbi:uncharacterized protein EDB93DRAFT_1339429 [Suillus bovinus]|uniref:uncharacterized protein n=1 Tax=Suillus bovinus TaxID=48563 RepID=UPI001B88255B|nr:uncharacterized protein EDB93DRAFT_1339429 [Suillus bovinus]KAG2136519.1 hypothetical protein EDB93DRAFT_1339429 [Suillus bovinus]